MKKVIFFFEDNWAFGSIHRALEKELYKNNIYSNVLDWRNSYSSDEIKYLVDIYDYFVTIPNVVEHLINGGIPLEKIICVAHSAFDIFQSIHDCAYKRTDLYNIHNYAVINEELKYIAQFGGVQKEVKIVKNGIHFDYLYSKPSESLKTVGYSTSMKSTNFFGQDKKRGYIAEKCAKLSNLNFNPIKDQTFLAMAGYYKTVDCVIQTALEEACGLSMLEAAAAGKLCIGTNTGYLKYHSPKSGISLPIDENTFIHTCVDILNYYKNNNDKYVDKCLEIQSYARDNYDWSIVIQDWIDLF
jgi:glycosyltransferase involved in cell wall biosynthesis